MSNSRTSLDETPLKGTVQGHVLKKTLPLESKPEDGWKTLVDGETWIEMVPESCYMVLDSDPLMGTDLLLTVFADQGMMAGPLQFRPAPEHSARKLIQAAKWKQRVQTFAALVVAWGWMAATAYYAITWMMSDHYGWVAGGLVMCFFSVFQMKTAGWEMTKKVVTLFRPKLSPKGPLSVSMAQSEEALQAA